MRRPAGPKRMTTDSGSHAPVARSSSPTMVTDSSACPSRLHTATTSTAALASTRAFPTASGGEPGEVSTATFRETRMAPMASASGRPWAEITVASSQGRPIRAKASDTEEGAGTMTRFLRSTTRRRARTMPKNPGSPEARTHTGIPSPAAAAARRQASSASLPMVTVWTCAPPRWRCQSSKASRCLRPPMTSWARPNAFCPSGPTPSSP